MYIVPVKVRPSSFPNNHSVYLHVPAGVLKHQILVPPAAIKSQKRIITTQVFSAIRVIH